MVWDLRADFDSDSADTSQLYQSDTFTIKLPDGFKGMSFPREDGQAVLVFENADGSKGFQVFTQAYAGPLTADALQEEIPDLFIIGPENITVDAEPALAFYSQDPDIGETFEVWFVHEGLLYQVMTYRPLDSWLRDVLASWKFK